MIVTSITGVIINCLLNNFFVGESYIIGPNTFVGIEFTKENVDKVLDEVRPYLIADGGNVEVISVDEFTRSVSLSLQGACGSCPSSTVSSIFIHLSCPLKGRKHILNSYKYTVIELNIYVMVELVAWSPSYSSIVLFITVNDDTIFIFICYLWCVFLDYYEDGYWTSIEGEFPQPGTSFAGRSSRRSSR